MAVFIDIPGIGNIEAKNAASEATLKEILKAMKGRGAGGVGAGTGGGTTGGSGAGNPIASMNRSAGSVTKVLGKFGGAVSLAAGAMVGLSEGAIDVIKSLSNIGDSVENAANVFSGIPIVGKMFSAVASASQKVTDSYLAAASGGAAFAGSMNQFVATASASGMTMEKFGQFVSQNGQAMLGLGATVEEGAKRFGQVSKGLRAVSGDLYALGFSTQDINQGLANYSRNLRLTGRQGTKSNDELVSGAKKYLKEMDMLAKVTGQSREEKEKELEQLKVDGQFSAAMAGLNEDVAASAEKLILSLPSKELQNLAKDVISTGSVSREQNHLLASQMPGLVTQLQGMHQQTQRNVKIADSQAISTLNNAKVEGKASQLRNKSALAGSEALEGVSVGLASAGRINTDAYKISSEEQKKAAAETDNMNKQMQTAQAELSKISNEFTMYLANSGILPVMLDAFKGLVGIVRDYIVPAFNFLSKSVQTVWNFLNSNLVPAFVTIGNYIREVSQTILTFGDFLWEATAPIRELIAIIGIALVPAFAYVADFMSDVFRKVGDTVQDYLTPVFNTVGRVITSVTDLFKNDFHGTIKDVSDFIGNEFIEPFVDLANSIGSYIKPIFDPMIKVFNDMRQSIAGWLAKWNSFSDIAETMKLRFQSFQISLQKLSLWIDEKTTFFANKKEKEDFEKRKQEIQDLERKNIEDRAALETKLSTQAADNLTAQEQRQAQIDADRVKRDKAIADYRSTRDREITEWQTDAAKNIFKGTTGTVGAMGNLTGQADAATSMFNRTRQTADAMGDLAENTQTVTANYDDSLALAGIEYARNNQSTPSAEAARAAVTNQPASEGVSNTNAASTTSGDSRGSRGSAGGRGVGTSAAGGTQDSAETLLAQLNSKMDQLIKINKDVHSVNERQLTVQQSMTGDLYVSV